MGQLEIKTYPDPMLRKKSKPVSQVGAEEKHLIANMTVTMYASRGIGLAAPQVGVLKRIIVLDAGEGLLKIVNPKLVSKKGSAVFEEGCLSVPEKSVSVTRPEEAKVTYVDENGKKTTKNFCGLEARVIQHEMDHLVGKLIVDYMPWYKKAFAKKKESKCRL